MKIKNAHRKSGVRFLLLFDHLYGHAAGTTLCDKRRTQGVYLKGAFRKCRLQGFLHFLCHLGYCCMGDANLPAGTNAMLAKSFLHELNRMVETTAHAGNGQTAAILGLGHNRH